MNKERILKLADAIEKGEITHRGKPVTFNMRTWWDTERDSAGNFCGTTACIGGSAELLFNGRVVAIEAVDLLELSEDQEEELFYPLNPGAKTQADAVRTLRRLADTGKVSWRR